MSMYPDYGQPVLLPPLMTVVVAGKYYYLWPYEIRMENGRQVKVKAPRSAGRISGYDGEGLVIWKEEFLNEHPELRAWDVYRRETVTGTHATSLDCRLIFTSKAGSSNTVTDDQPCHGGATWALDQIVNATALPAALNHTFSSGFRESRLLSLAYFCLLSNSLDFSQYLTFSGAARLPLNEALTERAINEELINISDTELTGFYSELQKLVLKDRSTRNSFYILDVELPNNVTGRLLNERSSFNCNNEALALNIGRELRSERFMSLRYRKQVSDFAASLDDRAFTVITARSGVPCLHSTWSSREFSLCDFVEFVRSHGFKGLLNDLGADSLIRAELTSRLGRSPGNSYVRVTSNNGRAPDIDLSSLANGEILNYMAAATPSGQLFDLSAQPDWLSPDGLRLPAPDLSHPLTSSTSASTSSATSAASTAPAATHGSAAHDDYQHDAHAHDDLWSDSAESEPGTVAAASAVPDEDTESYNLLRAGQASDKELVLGEFEDNFQRYHLTRLGNAYRNISPDMPHPDKLLAQDGPGKVKTASPALVTASGHVRISSGAGDEWDLLSTSFSTAFSGHSDHVPASDLFSEDDADLAPPADSPLFAPRPDSPDYGDNFDFLTSGRSPVLTEGTADAHSPADGGSDPLELFDDPASPLEMQDNAHTPLGLHDGHAPLQLHDDGDAQLGLHDGGDAQLELPDDDAPLQLHDGDAPLESLDSDDGLMLHDDVSELTDSAGGDALSSVMKSNIKGKPAPAGSGRENCLGYFSGPSYLRPKSMEQSRQASSAAGDAGSHAAGSSAAGNGGTGRSAAGNGGTGSSAAGNGGTGSSAAGADSGKDRGGVGRARAFEGVKGGDEGTSRHGARAVLIRRARKGLIEQLGDLCRLNQAFMLIADPALPAFNHGFDILIEQLVRLENYDVHSQRFSASIVIPFCYRVSRVSDMLNNGRYEHRTLPQRISCGLHIHMTLDLQSLITAARIMEYEQEDPDNPPYTELLDDEQDPWDIFSGPEGTALDHEPLRRQLRRVHAHPDGIIKALRCTSSRENPDAHNIRLDQDSYELVIDIADTLDQFTGKAENGSNPLGEHARRRLQRDLADLVQLERFSGHGLLRVMISDTITDISEARLASGMLLRHEGFYDLMSLDMFRLERSGISAMSYRMRPELAQMLRGRRFIAELAASLHHMVECRMYECDRQYGKTGLRETLNIADVDHCLQQLHAIRASRRGDGLTWQSLTPLQSSILEYLGVPVPSRESFSEVSNDKNIVLRRPRNQ